MKFVGQKSNKKAEHHAQQTIHRGFNLKNFGYDTKYIVSACPAIHMLVVI